MTDLRNIHMKKLGTSQTEIIKELYVSVFSEEPWNQDFSDDEQLDLLMSDYIGQNNSLSFGLFEGGELIGISLGRVLHCTSGTQYSIDEFCIRTDKQRKGFGSCFLDMIEEEIKKSDMTCIFLQTRRDVPAFDFYLKNYFYEFDEIASLARFLH